MARLLLARLGRTTVSKPQGLVDSLSGSIGRLERVVSAELMLPVGVVLSPAGKAAFSAGMVIRLLIPM